MVTQDVFDQKVSDLIEREIRFAYTTAVLRIQSDPVADKRETELMALQNVIYALEGWDVTDSYLSDGDIELLFEVGNNIVANWPHGITPVPFAVPSTSVTPSPNPEPSEGTGKYPASVNIPAGTVLPVTTTITTVPYSISLFLYNSVTQVWDDVSSDIGKSYALIGGFYVIYLSSETALNNVKLQILF